jgi:hypothetical protein
VRRALSTFPEVLRAEIDLQKQQVILRMQPSFDQYAALEQAVQDGGGAIRMFHTRYLVPQPIYACLGVKGHDPDKLERLEQKLKAIPGVRAASIDEQRWFTNEQGLDVGGAVLYTDPDPRLEKRLVRAAAQVGFTLETHEDGPAEMRDKEWSEMNHRVAGLFLLLLAGLAVLQLGLPRPRAWVRYSTLGVWLGLFVFLILRSDPEYWPLGRINWLEGFQDRESCQHRLAIALLIPLIVGDFLRLQHGWRLNRAITGWGVLALGLIGSIILFTHRHTTIEPAHAAMVLRMNAEHMAMATAVLGLGLFKFAWDKWRVPQPWGQYIWLVCLGILGLVLNLYVG